MFKIDIITLNESIMIRLQFSTNRIKRPLEPEIQLAKCAQRHYAVRLGL